MGHAPFRFGSGELSRRAGLDGGGGIYPANHLHSPITLIAVHLLTIGWMSVVILGALYQFVPVITTKPLFSQRLSLVSLVLIDGGLVGMICGFLGLAGVHPAGTPGLPIGGATVVVGFAVAIVNLGGTLWRTRPLPLPACFVAAGLGFLVLTGLLGLSFSLAFTLDTPPDWLAGLAATGLSSHVVAGLGGWFTLTAMGVSYRLFSMFMLSPERERMTSHLALWLTASGLVAIIAAGSADGLFASPMPNFAAFGGVLTGTGVILYLADMLSLYRLRNRRGLELNSLMAAVALIVFAGGGVLIAAAAVFDFGEDLVGPLGYVYLFGWLSGLVLSQLYKIVPFLTWLERFGPSLGKGPTPRVQDLVDERRARPWFLLYFAAVVACAVTGAIGLTGAWRALAGLQFLASSAIVRELWRARRADPLTGGRAPASVPIAAVLPAHLQR